MNEALRDVRLIVANMTVEEVAEQAGITERAYYMIEAGEREPSISNAIRITDALGITNFNKFRRIWSYYRNEKVQERLNSCSVDSEQLCNGANAILQSMIKPT